MKVTLVDPLANIELMEVAGGVVHLRGWIVHRSHPLSQLSFRLNGSSWIDSVPLHDRPDVLRNLYRDVPHTLHSGFDVTAAVDPKCWRARGNDLEILASHEGKDRGAARLALRDPAVLQVDVPVPPRDLQLHIGQQYNDFGLTGWRIYTDLTRALEPYGGMHDGRRILDWGCGCGRVLRYLVEDVDPAAVTGCDIDADAIAWLRGNIQGPSFDVIPGHPPTSYPDARFDLIYGISVFTHLDEKTQYEWLEELRRIAAPSGIVAVTVFNRAVIPPHLLEKVKKKGFADELSNESPFFAPFAGKEYYRLSYHDVRYITRRWSRYFDLLECISFAINAHQDLIIMRKRRKLRDFLSFSR